MVGRLRKVVVSSFVLSAALWAADPFVGTWKYNAAKSKFTKGQGPKQRTITIAESGGNLSVSMRSTGLDGNTGSSKYTTPIKGGAGTIIEATQYDAVSTKYLGEREREVQFSKNGKLTTKTHVMVSLDGKTLTSHVKGNNALGETVEGTVVYDQQ